MIDTLRSRLPHLLLAFAAMLALQPAAQATVAPQAWQQAKVALASGRPAAALTPFGRLMAFEGEIPGLGLVVARSALAGGDAARALAILDGPGAASDPLERACLRAQALLALGDLAGSEAAWREAGSSCPEAADLARQYAEAHVAQGQFDQAASFLASLNLLSPSRPDTLLRLGVLTALADPAGALPTLDAAMKASPSPLPLAEDLVGAIRSAPNDGAQAFAQVGETLIRYGAWREAAQALANAVALRPDLAEARAYLGLARDRSGGDGLRDLQEATRLGPGSSLPHIFLAFHWQAAERLTDALTELETAQRLDPGSPAAPAQMGAILVAMGDLPAASQAYRLATALAPSEPNFWLLLAQFSLEHEFDVTSIALPAARNAAALAPGDVASADALGYAHFLLGDLDLAERILVRAARSGPPSPSLEWHLGLLRLTQGDAERARAALQAAILLDPDGVWGSRARQSLDRLGP
jgi:tetratricopeptide (TPR) repeat protein